MSQDFPTYDGTATSDREHFFDSHIKPEQIQQLSPAALAYLGDAVYELYVRSLYLFPPKQQQLYHQQVVTQVRAETQARYLEILQPFLNEGELEIIRRGRNAATGKPRRLNRKIYQQASSLETLIGYLYLQDRQRLQQLLSQLDFPPIESPADNR
ncbi:ribonuclease III domain-containing protein [Geitlerinema sp. PCC 9228]|jgi:ribonuclease-3 family protein|uniref:Mini-ribonuclease 3 n=1 Tax=Geitlerinema sp. PCC 9228 TaxID=111611 RepID=UPI0008F9CD5F|nr:ribonuclease III domain-containing protein [Geitlerinema sp. PCC 9228]